MRFVLLAAVCSIQLCLFAGSADPNAPSPEPDRIILTWRGDPMTSMSVTWRTDTTSSKGLAQIAVSDDGPKFSETARDVKATTSKFSGGSDDALIHNVRFTSLKPDTLYAYRVGDGKRWSEWNQFRTATDKPAPLTFLYSGDAQTEIFSHWSRVIRAGFMHAPDARFIMYGGDIVNRGNRDNEWGDWFRAGSWINSTIPSLPSPGNHDYSSTTGAKGLTAHWRAQFDLPENGVPGLEETNYYVDIQGVRVISLNSNEKLAEQAEWLDNLLSGNPNKWTVVAFHHPVFSTAKSRDNKKVRELWQPVFEKHGVDLVLTGHDHTYARTNVTTGLDVREGKGGTVYVVSVAGPKMYRVQRENWMRRAAEDTQLIQVIRVNGDKLSFQAVTPTGRIYDAFELHKRSGKPTEIVELAPADPERLRSSPASTASGGGH